MASGKGPSSITAIQIKTQECNICLFWEVNMTTEFRDLSAIDFLLFMDDPDRVNRIYQEYKSIELAQRSFDESEAGNDRCLRLVHQFFCCSEREERYHGANFIDGYDTHDGPRKYSCVSNPKSEDCEKFWELVWRQEVTTIVKTSREDEEGSCQYWSSSEDSEIECGGFRVKTLRISEELRFTLTVLRLSDRADHECQIRHYQYTAGETDTDVDNPLLFLSFVCSLNDAYTISKTKNPLVWKPETVLVHCKYGRNFSAVYCPIDICVTQFKCTVIFVQLTSRKMYSQAERRNLAVTVLHLRDRILEMQKELDDPGCNTVPIKKRLQRLKAHYDFAQRELQFMCSRERFVESDVEMALL